MASYVRFNRDLVRHEVELLVEDLDRAAFPAALDVEVGLSCENLSSFEVFGTPDSDLVHGYNQFYSGEQSTYTVTKMKSVFPSEL